MGTGSEGLPKRWSARRKSEVVLRLLRGEDIGDVSGEIRVPPPELERWRRMFLEGTCEGLKGRNAPDGGADAGAGEACGDDDACGAPGGAARKMGGRPEEALEARGRVSPSTGRAYPLTLVCAVWRVPRSSVYALRHSVAGGRKPGKRGPRTELSDGELVAEIRLVLSESPFVGEPECNGVAERFIRTLREGCVYLHDFEMIEEAREVIGAFIERYNGGWLLQRARVSDPGPRPREARPQEGGLMKTDTTAISSYVRLRNPELHNCHQATHV